ncbi:hypothetical protein B0A52_08763 [Exophiala mesophila]|uniref:Major facilitator superfamily (MFS) profile domain-containing protein n=1 Tax=Exophiala mesophila TaxID=212818 RepID=A0A438MUJ0_EXOME|nr:hypothetical protein B0A52_08763 [Exophiala mesophila]
MSSPHHDYKSNQDVENDSTHPPLPDAPTEEKESVGASQVPIQPPTVIPPAPATAKDGGLRAWLQVLGCWLVFFNVWGFTFAFGLFQNYYEMVLLPNMPPSAISWVGTVASYLLIVTGVISGPLFDLGYYRTMLFGGAAASTFGTMMLSLSSQYYSIILSQGILMGLGCGVLYIPGLALVSRSFTKRRPMALGIVTCGAPVGGIIYTIIFNSCIDSIGFGWTVRVMGFIMFACYAAAFPLLLWNTGNTGDISSGTARKIFDKKAFADVGFWLYTWSNFFIFCGYLVPFFYMPSYAETRIGMSRSLALYSIAIASGVSVFGRLVAAYAAQKTGVMIPWIVCVVLSAIMCLVWIAIETQQSFLAFAALYGGFSGALIPLPPTIFPVVCPDPKVLGARLGMAQAIGAFASLIGSPIAGALVRGDDDTHPSYLGLQLFCGLMMLFGSCLLGCLWLFLVRRRTHTIWI